MKTKGDRKTMEFKTYCPLGCAPIFAPPNPINCSIPIYYSKLKSQSSNAWSLVQVPEILRSCKEGERKSQWRELSRVVPGSVSQCLGRKGMVPRPGS